jgi:hypothetical protein
MFARSFRLSGVKLNKNKNKNKNKMVMRKAEEDDDDTTNVEEECGRHNKKNTANKPSTINST